MVILQSILVFVHMCVIPYLIGCLFFGKKEQKIGRECFM